MGGRVRRGVVGGWEGAEGSGGWVGGCGGEGRGGVGGWEGAEGRGGGPPTHKKWLTVKKQSISIIQLFKYIRSLILYMH